jgi:hypothetical protein
MKKAGGGREEERTARFTVVNSFGCDIPSAEPSEMRTHMTESDIFKRQKRKKDPLHLKEGETRNSGSLQTVQILGSFKKRGN